MQVSAARAKLPFAARPSKDGRAWTGGWDLDHPHSLNRLVCESTAITVAPSSYQSLTTAERVVPLPQRCPGISRRAQCKTAING